MERPRSGLAMLRELWCLRLTPETMAFSGCSITSGVGKGLVTDTGMKTRAFHQRARKKTYFISSYVFMSPTFSTFCCPNP